MMRIYKRESPLGRPLFPNARYIMHEKEWNHLIPLPDEKSAELRNESEDKPNLIVVGRKNLLPIRNYFDIVKGEDDVIPGIKLLLAPGHTPGYVAVMISSGRKQLLCVGDLLHETAEFSTPGLWARSDHSPEEAADTRDRIISLAADSEQ